MTAVERHQVLSLTLGQVLINLAPGIVCPLYPCLAQEMGFGASGIALLVAAPNLARFACSLPAGVYADTRGRVPAMVLGEATVGVSQLCFSAATSLGTMLPWRFGLGAGGCVASAGAQAYTADVTDGHLRKFRGTIMGLQNSVIGLAYIAGPALGGVLVEFGGARGAWTVVGVSALCCAVVFARLPETLKYAPGSVSPAAKPLSQAKAALETWRALLMEPQQRACIAGLSAIHLNWACTMVVLPLQAAQLGANTWQIGLLLAAGGMVSAVVAPGSGSLSDRLGRVPVCLAGLTLMSFGNVALAFSQSAEVLCAAWLLWCLAEGLVLPAAFAYAADIAAEKVKAQTFALHRVAGDFVWILSPLLLGLMADSMSLSGPWAVVACATGLATFLMHRWAHFAAAV